MNHYGEDRTAELGKIAKKVLSKATLADAILITRLITLAAEQGVYTQLHINTGQDDIGNRISRWAQDQLDLAHPELSTDEKPKKKVQPDWDYDTK